MQRFTHHRLYHALVVVWVSSLPVVAVANNATHAETAPIASLERENLTIRSTRINKQNQDVTKLGAITKTQQTLKAQQVEGIRDLVRYDTGVSVNESSGRGTSSGFAIRGVEKDRVAVLVDGIGQPEVVKAYGHGSGIGSGGVNEVEYENLKLVEISKGAVSTYAGSGALGGAVMMQTKDARDFITTDKDWGGSVKMGYTDKDKRHVLSVGMGGVFGGNEMMVQFTKRQGHEIRPHKDIYRGEPIVVKDVITQIKDERETRIGLDKNQNPFTYSDPNLTPLKQDVTFAPNDITGASRYIPNPLDYDSQSLLVKFGKQLNDKHYVGVVAEDTKQTYTTRDMFKYGYYAHHSESDRADLNIAGLVHKNGEYTNGYYSYQFMPLRYHVETHHNQRYGAEYRYTPTDSWFDKLSIKADVSKINLNTDRLTLNCSKTADINCTPQEIGQFRGSDMDKRQFDSKQVDINLHKNWQLGTTKHQLQVATGINRSKLTLSREETKSSVGSHRETTDKNGVQYDEDIAVFASNTWDRYKNPVHKHNYYVALNDNIQITDKLDATMGLRYDDFHFTSDQGIWTPSVGYFAGQTVPLFVNNRQRNLSYNLGLSYQLTDNLEVLYKYGTGFRVPSMSEQLGLYPFEKRSSEAPLPIKKETAKNHEFGINYYADFGDMSLGYFRTDYHDFIGKGRRIFPSGGHAYGYFNLQNVKVEGFDVKGRLDLNALWHKVPVGWSAHVGASKITLRDKPVIPDGYQTSTYAFDMAQPLKVVYGISYDAADDKWGVSVINTYSDAKKASELSTNYQLGGLVGTSNANDFTTPSWQTTDLLAYYSPNDKWTLRAGVYNVFDYRYLNWDQGRVYKALKEDLGLQDSYLDPRILAAPGRNYGVSVEFKF